MNEETRCFEDYVNVIFQIQINAITMMYLTNIFWRNLNV